MNLKTAVITGATSFIGSAVLRELIGNGVNCTAIVRPGSRSLNVLPTENELFRVIRADVSKPEEWADQITGKDVLFHFAWDGVGAEGRSNPVIQQANIEMAANCMKAAAQQGIKRFVFAGSQAEYGIRDGIITEDTPCKPVIEYGKAKLRFLEEAQKIREETGIEYVHLRIFSVYGPGDHPWTLVSQCVDRFCAGREMELSSCVQPWNFVYITDAAKAIRELAGCELMGQNVFNIAGTDTRPLKEFVEQIRILCGNRGYPLYGQQSSPKEKPHGIEPDISRMQAVTGWRPALSFEEGIKTMLSQREQR